MEFYKISIYSPELTDAIEEACNPEFKETERTKRSQYKVFYFEVLPDFTEISRIYGVEAEDGEDFDVEEIDTLTEDDIFCQWVEMHLESHIESDSKSNCPDSVARRECFNDFVDYLEKSGQALRAIAENVCIPDDLETEMHYQRAERKYC